MQVLILTPGFPQDEQDTTCIPFLQDYVLGLYRTMGVDQIRIISFQYPFQEGLYTWNGLEVYAAAGRNKKGMRRMFTWRKVMKQAGKWMTNDTVLHSFWLTEAALIGQQLQTRYGCRHISTIMGQDVLSSNRYLKKLVFDSMEVIAPNEQTASLLQVLGSTPSRIIPHAIAPVAYQELERPYDLLWVGSFIPLKQPGMFIRLVTELHRSDRDLRCLMIGEGPMLEKTRKEAADLPVEIPGPLDRQQVLQFMMQARMLVHTSNYEGHSTVISEALACGCQVVSFDVGRTASNAVQVAADEDDMLKKLDALLSAKHAHHPIIADDHTAMLRSYLHLYTASEE